MATNQKTAQDREKPRTALPSGWVQIQASKPVVYFAAAAILLVGLLVGALGFVLGRTRPALAPASTGAGTRLNSRIQTFVGGAGPWGTLECQRTIIEVADENLAVRLQESARIHWFFRGYTADALSNLVARLPAAPAELLDRTKWTVSTNGIDLSVSPKTVLALSAAERATLYSVLSQFEEDPLQYHPFHWPVDAKEDLFAGTRLSEETRSLFLRLCYQRGQTLLFADHGVLLGAVPDAAEKLALAKLLSRRFALFVSLKLKAKPDIESIINYWGRGGFAPDIRPILEAVARSGEDKIGIGVLLPPFVRAHLYRYPPLDDGPQPDAHWTSFNFWKNPPDPPTADGAFWRLRLKTDYTPVSGPPAYGDLLLLGNADGQIIHSCVYLADNIVYTKNGGGPGAPWELMTVPDLLEYFSWDLPENENLRVHYFRPKQIPAS